MTLKKFDEIWAANGDTDTPTDEKIDEGWVGGDRPSIEYFNWILNRLDRQVSDLASERVVPYHTEGTSAVSDYESAIATGLWTDPWNSTSDTANVISGGSTKKYKDIVAYINSDGYPRLIVVDDSLYKFEVWNPRTKTLVDTSDSFRDDLPSGGSETWFCISMCTDGTSVYGIFADANASPDVYRVQAWDIATWDVKTGWPATGTALSGSGSTGPGFTRIGDIIVASSTKLACVCGWNTITASTSAAISIVDMSDGTIDASGAGDAPTGVSAQSSNICSDGTYIYFCATNPTPPDSYICTASIASPTTGCGGSNYPLTMSNSNFCAMVSAGSFVVSINHPSGSAAESDQIIRTHNSSDADLDILVRGQDGQSTPFVSSRYILDDPYRVVFDGLNVWILCDVNEGGAGFQSPSVVKLDTSRLRLQDVGWTPCIEYYTTGTYLIDPETAGLSSLSAHSSMCFDGRDIWVVLEQGASVPRSGDIFRLPLALLRS